MQSSDGSVSVATGAAAAAAGYAGVSAAVDPELLQAGAQFGGCALIAGAIVLLYAELRRRGRRSR